MKARFAALALAIGLLAPSLAHAQMPAGPALFVDARLGAGVGVAGNSGIIIVPSLTVGVRLFDRLQLGLGIGLFRTAQPAAVDINGNPVGSQSDTAFTFVPTVMLDILKSRDNRVAWYGKVSLPLGAEIRSVPNNDLNLFAIGYDFALGIRYAPHPNFAFGFEGGLSGIFVDPNGPNGSGTTSFYGAIVGTFYWGKEHSGHYAAPPPPPPPPPPAG